VVATSGTVRSPFDEEEVEAKTGEDGPADELALAAIGRMRMGVVLRLVGGPRVKACAEVPPVEGTAEVVAVRAEAVVLGAAFEVAAKSDDIVVVEGAEVVVGADRLYLFFPC
jgi:hypothetical protein